MKLKNVVIPCKSRADTFRLYVLGDLHVGARNCAESYIKHLIDRIKEDPHALWIGGGDYINAVKIQDAKRFNPSEISDWMLEGDADTTRNRLRDMVDQEAKRFIGLTGPIHDKCMGLIEGNHEFSIGKYYNDNLQERLCREVGTTDLTDAAFLRLQFKRGACTRTVVVFVCHGFGSGRTPGSEPNRLYRLAADKDADIVLTGHSHTFTLLPPIPVLCIPRSGALGEECSAKYKRVANWGSWTRTYAAGPSTYDSRALYPARSLSTLEITVEPHRNHGEGTDPAKLVSMGELVL